MVDKRRKEEKKKRRKEEKKKYVKILNDDRKIENWKMKIKNKS